MAENDTSGGAGTSDAVYDTPKGGAFRGKPVELPTGLDDNVVALLMGYRWTRTLDGTDQATDLKYSFPTGLADYTVVPGYPDGGYNTLSSVHAATGFVQAAARAGFGLVGSYTNLKLEEERSSGLAKDATFRIALVRDDGTSHAGYPSNIDEKYASDSRSAGDIFLAKNGKLETNDFYGTDAFNTIIHEMGHALGLRHGHPGGSPSDPDAIPLAPEFDGNEFSVMTYASYLGSYLGASNNVPTAAIEGSAPQSYMMFDIAALQVLYGANFSRKGTEAVYSWDANGQQYINGVKAENTGASATKKIFTTVWTQGATATYDFSTSTEDGSYDLRPGGWSTFSIEQLADLNNAAPERPSQYRAKGNVYNALLYENDTSSAVSNIIAGSGNDTILGNQVDNAITGGRGNDRIDGLEGLNTAIYSAASKNYAVTLYAGVTAYEIKDRFGSDGLDTLTDIQRLAFADQTLDTSAFRDVVTSNNEIFRPLDALYASYLQRAPDMSGLHYWIAQVRGGMNILDVSESFFAQPETQTLFPTNGTSEEIVKAVYRAALGRTPDGQDSGSRYWIDALDTNAFTAGGLMIAVINGALANAGRDFDHVSNRALVGGTFALTEGLGNVEWAKRAMAGVDENVQTRDAAIAMIDGFAADAAQQATSELVVKLVGISLY